MVEAVFIAAPLALLMAFARDRAERILAIVLVVAFRVTLGLGAFHFTLPSQVLELVQASAGDPSGLLRHEHWGVWWPRYVFTWPAIGAAGATGTSLDQAFALYVTALLPIEAFLLSRAATLASPSARTRMAVGLAIAAVLLAVATLMNGRLVIAHTGMALILATQIAAVRRGAFARWSWPALALGALMGHMTTGAGLVAFVQASLGTVAAAEIGAAHRRTARLFAVVLAVALAPLLFGDVWKNLVFFGFDPVALVEHGLGDRLLATPALWVVAAAVLFAAAVGAAHVWRHRADLDGDERSLSIAGGAVAISAVGGLFGYSTLSMGLPPTLLMAGTLAHSRSAVGRRLLDLTVGGAALLLLSPLIAVLALAVRLTSAGPAFYGARRIGWHERPFTQWKLRTMFAGADRGSFRTADSDPRITPVGRSLRATSLDELPQLWNVVRGDMSLVGPRPAALEQRGDYTPEQLAERSRVRPGITGLAQVSGRSALTTDQSVALDLHYARNASLWLDVVILVRTIPAVLARRGVN